MPIRTPPSVIDIKRLRHYLPREISTTRSLVETSRSYLYYESRESIPHAELSCRSLQASYSTDQGRSLRWRL